MLPLTDGDDDGMKALRAHSQQIESGKSVNNIGSSSREYQRFIPRKLTTAVERDDTRAWNRLGFGRSIDKRQWDINGKVCVIRPTQRHSHHWVHITGSTSSVHRTQTSAYLFWTLKANRGTE